MTSSAPPPGHRGRGRIRAAGYFDGEAAGADEAAGAEVAGTEAGATGRIFRIDSLATAGGVPGNLAYVERSLSASLER